MTRDALQSILQQPYDRARWLEMMRHVLPGTAVFASPQPVATANTGAQSIAHLARVTLDGGKQLVGSSLFSVECRHEGNPKAEIRNPKEARNPRSEPAHPPQQRQNGQRSGSACYGGRVGL